MPAIRFIVLLAFFILLASAPCLALAQLPWEQNPSDARDIPNQGQADQQGGGFIQSLLSGAQFTGLTIGDMTVLGVFAGLGAYLLLRSRGRHDDDQRRHDQQGNPVDDDVPGPGRDSRAYRRAQQTWDYLSTKPGSSNSQGSQDAQSPDSRTGPPPAPGSPPQSSHGFDLGSDLGKDLPTTPSAEEAGFDTGELLQGAKVVYARMHESIAESDWDDVAQFTTTEFLEQLKHRVGDRRTPPQVLFVEAAVEKAESTQDRNMADVVFASLLQFGQNQAPQEVREIWRFEKGSDTGGRWRISSMQRKG